MKVKCTKLIDSKGNPLDQSPWCTVGKVYYVLSVLLGSNGKWLLRLIGDGKNGVAMFNLEGFEVVSNRIPNTWIATWDEKGVFALTPSAWNQRGFWEKFYDRDPETVRIFEEEKRKIIEADP